MPQALYDSIGRGYARHRRADPRLAARIHAALGDARTVVNVGAGAGSYEPAGRRVVAAEPSAVMVRQRAPGSAPAVRASADALPFHDGAFDAAMAVLTLHHWPDWRRGLREMRRVARRTVLFTWDPAAPGFWLVQDYFPAVLEVDRPVFPTFDEIAGVLGPVDVQPVPIPADCTDGFLAAYWRRPEAYLDADLRGAISVFARIPDLATPLARLAADLADGTWARRWGSLLEQTELDAGYRLVTAGPARVPSCDTTPDVILRPARPVTNVCTLACRPKDLSPASARKSTRRAGSSS
jgi:SAM-dependent methyltransferase